MKFARYLASHVIDEWRTRYVDCECAVPHLVPSAVTFAKATLNSRFVSFWTNVLQIAGLCADRQLKKQIGRAENELMELDEGKAGAATGEGVRKPQPRRQTTMESVITVEAPRHAAEDYMSHEKDLERAEAESDDENGQNTMSRSPQSYEQGHLSRPDNERNDTSLDRPSTSRRMSGMSASSREHSDETTRTGTNLVPKTSTSRKTSRNPLPKPSGEHFKPGMDRVRSSDDRQTLRKWRFGLTHKNSLEEVFDKIPPQSQRFFKLTDKELVKVGAFWDDRMEQAWTRYEELSAQWKELAGGSCLFFQNLYPHVLTEVRV